MYDETEWLADQLVSLPSVSALAEMAAVGMGLPAETFTDAGRYG